MAAQVPAFVWPIVFAADAAIIAYVLLAIRRHGGPRAGPRAAGAGVLLSAWFVLVALLSGAGAFVAGPAAFPAIALGVLPPILAGVLALAGSRTVRDLALAIPLPWLAGIQSLRVLGLVFVVLLGRGVLPAQFALPAGWGDFTVGVTAPFVAWALAARKPWAPRLAVAFNAFGILDLSVAVTMGALSTDSAVRVFVNGPSATAMAQLPLSLIPTFGVPLFLLFHVASLLGLRARARSGALEGARVPRYA